MPHAPQLFVSLDTLVQVSPQVSKPGAQAQTLSMHDSLAAHGTPQLPQFASSEAGSTQRPSQSSRPGGHPHAPPVQTRPSAVSQIVSSAQPSPLGTHRCAILPLHRSAPASHGSSFRHSPSTHPQLKGVHPARVVQSSSLRTVPVSSQRPAVLGATQLAALGSQMLERHTLSTHAKPAGHVPASEQGSAGASVIVSPASDVSSVSAISGGSASASPLPSAAASAAASSSELSAASAVSAAASPSSAPSSVSLVSSAVSRPRSPVSSAASSAGSVSNEAQAANSNVRRDAGIRRTVTLGRL